MDALTSEATLAVGQAGDGRLTPADYALIGAKSRANRLGFAVMLLFFRERGRFPRGRHLGSSGTVNLGKAAPARFDGSAERSGSTTNPGFISCPSKDWGAFGSGSKRTG